MFEEFQQRISIERFFRDATSLQIKNPSDHISYAEFVRFFMDREVITRHDLIIGINFTYGWMPTIFEFQSDRIEEAVAILNRTRLGAIPLPEELLLLKGLLNNSLVGTSKLLHFINPERIAIWDSRVYRYLTGKEPHDYRIGKVEAFTDYLKFCEYLTGQPGYQQIHGSIEQKIGYQVSKFRSAELVMYSNCGSKAKSR